MNGAGSRLAQAIHAGRGFADPAATAPLSTVRKWLITFSVMLVTVMQILDTSVTNVALPHMQGSLSAGVEEMSWIIVLPRRERDYHPGDGLALGPARAPTLLPDLHGPVHGHPDLASDPLGDLPAPSAGDGDGALGRRDHAGPDPRPDPRRLDRRQLVVAVDLLHQPPDRPDRLHHGQRVRVRLAPSAKARAGRRARTRADGGGVRVPAADPGLGRARGLVRLAPHHRARRGGRLRHRRVRLP